MQTSGIPQPIRDQQLAEARRLIKLLDGEKPPIVKLRAPDGKEEFAPCPGRDVSREVEKFIMRDKELKYANGNPRVFGIKLPYKMGWLSEGLIVVILLVYLVLNLNGVKPLVEIGHFIRDVRTTPAAEVFNDENQ